MSELAVSDTDRHSLAFTSGAELVVTPHPQYEAWSVAGDGVQSVSVGPGGERDWHR